MLEPIADVDALVATRTALHTLAERVLAPARHAATGRIGLRPTPGGITTGQFGPDDRSVAVVDTRLLVGLGPAVSATELDTLGAAAAAAGVPVGADTGVYPTTTPVDPATRVAPDPEAARRLARWFGLGAEVLGRFRTMHADETPTPVQLWPEHFDLATDLGPDGARANYGASPGDADHPLPYLYVGPWEVTPDPFWDAGSFARCAYPDLLAAPDPVAAALAFLAAGHARASRKS
jgi:hypothetical protein